MKKSNSKLVSVISRIQEMADIINNDKITVYAGQASFFTLIAVVPFLSLIISVLSIFLPEDAETLFYNYTASEELLQFAGSLIDDLHSTPKISLLSFSAITALWITSRGMSAIRRGIETIYSTKAPDNFIYHCFKSLINTLMYVILIIGAIVLLLFGDFISAQFQFINVTEILMQWRLPLLVILMIIAFTIMYASTVQRNRSFLKTILPHLPGAILAAIGWILFSYAYAFYIRYFPNASYIYGSLGAICLIMLWLYSCMIILLLGAEFNKLCWNLTRKKS